MQNNNQKAQYTITSAVIHADRFTIAGSKSETRLVDFEVFSDLVELIIYESLDKLYLTGQVSIIDKQGIFSTIQFQGTEKITFAISTADVNDTPIIFNKTFIMSEIISQSKHKSGKSSLFVFNLIDEHGFLGRVSKISKSYNGSLERIIKNILQNELGRTVDIAYTGAKSGDEEFSIQGDITCIIPNMTPITAINWLCNRITTDNGTPYFAYSTLNLPNQKGESDESQLDDEDKEKGNLIRIGNLDTMLTQEAFNNIPFVYNPNSRSGLRSSVIEQLFKIKNISFDRTSNTLKLLELGAVSSEYSNTNLGTGEVFTTKHVLSDQLRNLSSNSIIGKNEETTQNVFDEELLLKGSRVETYSAKNYHTITSTGTYGNLKSYHDETDENKFKVKISSTAIKNVLHKNSISIVVEGASLAIGRVTVGDIINIVVVSDNVDDEGKGVPDMKNSGKHLIYDLKHTFSGEIHNATLTLCKLESIQ
jgi:hypothetical protein